MFPGQRFISHGAKSRHYFRKYRRQQRRSGKSAVASDLRAGSRHRLYPCCGRRRAQCACDWTYIASFVKPRNWARFKQQLRAARLFRIADTADSGAFLKSPEGVPTGVTLAQYFFVCLAFRRFNNLDTWSDIRAAVTAPQPDWSVVRRALLRRLGRGEAVFGNAFYPATLKSYRRSVGAPWRSTSRMTVAQREVVSLQMLRDAIPQDAMAEYERSPSADTYARWYDDFMNAVSTTTHGLFSDYSMKVVLDLMVCSGAVSEHHISRWPLGCPGYKDKMRELFGNLDRSHWLRALYWMHRELAQDHGGALSFPEVLMQLCWAKRRDAGRLSDCS